MFLTVRKDVRQFHEKMRFVQNFRQNDYLLLKWHNFFHQNYYYVVFGTFTTTHFSRFILEVEDVNTGSNYL